MSDEHETDDDEQECLITETINRWLASHEPLPRTEFDRINSALMRTVGDPVDHSTNGRNGRVREADAEAFGRFAFESDVALVELAEDAQYGDLHGYPVAGGGRWVPILVTTDDTDGVLAAEHRIHQSYHVIEDIAPSRLNHGEVVVTDGGQSEPNANADPERCETTGCENPPVTGGYCEECISISPGILDNDDGDSADAPEEGHRTSDVSVSPDGESERETGESVDSASHSTVEDGSDDTNLDFKSQKPNAGRKCTLSQTGVPPSDHFITEARDETYHKLRKINSAEGESHLPAGGSSQPSTCFFPAQDNIVCHSSSGSFRLSPVTTRVSDSLGHDGSPGRQRWNDGAHP